MKLKPGMIIQSVIEIAGKRERQGHIGFAEKSLAMAMLALAVGIDFITYPIAITGAIVDRLISLPKKNQNSPTSA